MKKISELQHIHFVGLGGIGMSALAQLFSYDQKKVSGSDRTESVITEMLRARRIIVSVGHKAENVPPETELLVYSDAIPFSNPERVEGRSRKIPELSYFEALGQVAAGKRTIAVSGTHGKTTTTGMIAKILVDAGKSPTAVVGSIMKDFSSNFVSGTSDIFVVEACEYRKHLLHIAAEVLVITNLEWDHTDFFETFAAYQDAFREEAVRVPATGAIVTNPSLPEVAAILPEKGAKVVDYTKRTSPALLLLGDFNKDNARAAKAAVQAMFPDIAESAIDTSLATFQGTWRRFEYKGTTKRGAQVYDDYGHHPTEVRSTISAAKSGFPNKKIIVAFHPHLYSRTKDLLEDFSTAFADADEVLIAPIFAAREEPIPGIDHHVLAEKISAKNEGHVRAFDSLEAIEQELSTEPDENDLIITMGAGDIYKVAEAIATP